MHVKRVGIPKMKFFAPNANICVGSVVGWLILCVLSDLCTGQCVKKLLKNFLPKDKNVVDRTTLEIPDGYKQCHESLPKDSVEAKKHQKKAFWRPIIPNDAQVISTISRAQIIIFVKMKKRLLWHSINLVKLLTTIYSNA